jgi:hypothetical protein
MRCGFGERVLLLARVDTTQAIQGKQLAVPVLAARPAVAALPLDFDGAISAKLALDVGR